VRFAAVRVELVFGDNENAVIVGAPFVGIREARGAFGDGAIADHFHGAHTDPVVAEAGADSGGEHGVDVTGVNEAVGAEEENAGFAGLLIGEKVGGSALGFVSGSDAGTGEHFGDELDAFAVIVTREILWQDFVDEVLSSFGNTTGESTG
jgi:hypothetical protein